MAFINIIFEVSLAKFLFISIIMICVCVAWARARVCVYVRSFIFKLAYILISTHQVSLRKFHTYLFFG